MEDTIYEVEYSSPNGQIYKIVLMDSGNELHVTEQNVKIGSISLRFIEGDYPYIRGSYHITHLELDSCKRQGLGRRCLQLHKETFNAPITAGNAYDGEMEDGSHLIDDGPGFVEKMRAEGLICLDRYSNEFNYSDGGFCQ
jgi:hypothetical protein